MTPTEIAKFMDRTVLTTRRAKSQDRIERALLSRRIAELHRFPWRPVTDEDVQAYIKLDEYLRGARPIMCIHPLPPAQPSSRKVYSRRRAGWISPFGKETDLLTEKIK